MNEIVRIEIVMHNNGQVAAKATGSNPIAVMYALGQAQATLALKYQETAASGIQTATPDQVGILLGG